MGKRVKRKLRCAFHASELDMKLMGQKEFPQKQQLWGSFVLFLLVFFGSVLGAQNFSPADEDGCLVIKGLRRPLRIISVIMSRVLKQVPVV